VFAQHVQPGPVSQRWPSVNYLVTHDLVVDIDTHEHGLINHQTLFARREIKWGKPNILISIKHGYAKCQYMYRHEWKALYTIPEHKLTGEIFLLLVLVQWPIATAPYDEESSPTREIN
jgi:hypothetical protein